MQIGACSSLRRTSCECLTTLLPLRAAAHATLILQRPRTRYLDHKGRARINLSCTTTPTRRPWAVTRATPGSSTLGVVLRCSFPSVNKVDEALLERKLALNRCPSGHKRVTIL